MRSDPLRLQDILDAIQVIEKYLPIDRASFDHVPIFKPQIQAILASFPNE